MVRIFPDRIRIWSGLEGFLSARIRFRVSNIHNHPYPNAQKLHFYDVDIHYNLIRQKLTLSVFDSVFKHKYENNIRSVFIPNPIHLPPIRLQHVNKPCWCDAGPRFHSTSCADLTARHSFTRDLSLAADCIGYLNRTVKKSFAWIIDIGR